MNGRTLQVPRSATFREMTDDQLDRWHADLAERAPELERRIDLKRNNGEDTFSLESVLFHTNRGLKAIAQVRRQRNGEPPPLTQPKPVHSFESACVSVKAMLRLLGFYEDHYQAGVQLCEAVDAEDEDAEQAAWDALDVAQRAIRAAYAANLEVEDAA